jgi:hypothetical protein
MDDTVGTAETKKDAGGLCVSMTMRPSSGEKKTEMNTIIAHNACDVSTFYDKKSNRPVPSRAVTPTPYCYW